MTVASGSGDQKIISPVPEIQISSRFVGQQDGRLADQGPRQSDPLLLPAGKLPRAMPSCAIAKAYLLKPFHPAAGCLRLGPAANQQRHHHVFQRRELGQQIVTLPDESHLPVSEIRQPGIR